MSADQRHELLRKAAEDGRIASDHAERLRGLGLLPPEAPHEGLV